MKRTHERCAVMYLRNLLKVSVHPLALKITVKDNLFKKVFGGKFLSG